MSATRQLHTLVVARTYPEPTHRLHEAPCKHHAIPQILTDARLRQRRPAPEQAILFEQVHVACQAEQECQSHRDRGEEEEDGGVLVEGGSCEVGEADEGEEDGDEGGGFAGLVEGRHVGL